MLSQFDESRDKQWEKDWNGYCPRLAEHEVHRSICALLFTPQSVHVQGFYEQINEENIFIWINRGFTNWIFFGRVNRNRINKDLGPTFRSFIVQLSWDNIPLTKKYWLVGGNEYANSN